MTIKDNGLSAADARKLVLGCFTDMVARQEVRGAFVPRTSDPEMENREQQVLARDRLTDLRVQIEASNFDAGVQQRVSDLITRQGIGPHELAEARRHDLANGVARVLAEEQRLFLLRLEDRLAPYSPTDPLFIQPSEGPTYDFGGTLQTPSPFNGPALRDAVDSYLAAHKKVWKIKTYKAREKQLGYLVEFLGADRPLASIKPGDVRNYRDAVLKLRANHGFEPSQTFASKQTDAVAARIKDKTADLIFRPAKTFFKWAVSTQGYIESSPAQLIKLTVKKEKNPERKRRPFEPDEIKVLFSSSLFTGCTTKARRFVPGENIYRDAKYWIPILGYYTGCRLGELVQLAISDVLGGDFPHLDVNERALLGSEEKSVKTEAGFRQVPLHPDIVTLGFLEFVAKRAKHSKPNDRLFSEVQFGVDGQASTEYSKFFGRQMDKVGLTDPKLVFHSFRHGVEDALRDAGHQTYLIDRIVGHVDQTSGKDYGKGVSLETKSAAVATMKLPVSLLTVLPPS